MVCVILNTGILAIDGLYSNPPLLDVFNTLFTFIFAGEMVLKIIINFINFLKIIFYFADNKINLS